jgi:ribosome biogenesis GTPase
VKASRKQSHQQSCHANGTGDVRSAAVVFVSRQACEVETSDGRITAQLLPSGQERPVVGDRVKVRPTNPGTGVVVGIEPRHSALRRRAGGKRPEPQVFAANVDRMLAVIAAADPVPRWPTLDRLLICAEQGGVVPIVCVTKSDLDPAGRALRTAERYAGVGYDVLAVSAHDGSGLDALRRRLVDRTTVLIGASGVGKSSLLNALLGQTCAAAGAVNRKTRKGRHTTSASRLHAFPEGGAIIDTPGVRTFAFWDLTAPELAAYFPEMRGPADACAIRDCLHVDEPGCAVRTAARDGAIHPERYRSYAKIMRGLDGMGERTIDEHCDGDTFRCGNCGAAIPADASGTRHRNHCPRCLWSMHVDVRPGDRSEACRGSMEPIAVWAQPRGEWAIVHRCVECAAVRTNRIAGDDNEMLLMSLAMQALANPPFPLDRLQANGVAASE